jgi:hypothetical protein
MARLWRLSLIFCLLVTLLPLASAQAQSPGVSEARFARLARGINLPLWFWYGPEDPADMAEHFTPSDFELIRTMGFTHVRVPIDLGRWPIRPGLGRRFWPSWTRPWPRSWPPIWP